MSNIKLKPFGALGAHMEHGNIDLNAPCKMRSKRRSYRFTLNNYTENDPKHLAQTFLKFRNIKKFAFQEEIGLVKKTPHLQGCVFFKNDIHLSTMIAINKRVIWFPLTYPRQAIAYCLKTETRKPNGGRWYHGIKIEDYEDKPRVPLMGHQEMLDEICQHMKDELIGIVDEWHKAELKEYGNKYKYLCM